jgi:muramoyltetrapeptide carboxypeptidase
MGAAVRAARNVVDERLSLRVLVIRPPRLAPGDTIRIVAPSGPVPREEFEAGAKLLAARYRLAYDPETLFRAEGFLAGPDELRLEELSAAIADPEARAVVMARGGYGLTRILPLLAPDLLRGNPKPIVGFSDGTALLAFAAQAGVASVHGPVVAQFARIAEEDRDALFGILERPGPGLLFTGLDAAVPGRVQGPLLGGNLEVFSRLLGTPFLPDVTGAILFFEDIGERPYRIDRLITHLDLAGVWGAAAAVVLGEFVNCEERKDSPLRSPTTLQVLEERLSRLAIPVAFGAKLGHGARNIAVPYGTMVELDTRHGTLTAVEGAVS